MEGKIMNKNMTAFVSAFARIYHIKNSNIKIYNDMYAEKIITEDEYNEISTNMKNGISFFNPNYKGTDPLKWVVNNNLHHLFQQGQYLMNIIC